MDREPIGVIGVGWVGLVTAAGFAELGHEVYARDILQEKVDALSRGEVPIHEPGLAELVTKNRDRLHFTTDMADVVDNAQLLFCCVDTPPTYSGDADLSRVERVVEELGGSTEHALVMKSTVPVGTGRWIQRLRGNVGYVSCPEFLKEGAAVEDFMNPDRVVVGAGPESAEFADRVERLYEPLGGPIVRTDVASAEMIKLASNAFLATKISFINEIANVSEELGADVEEVARGMGLDRRIGPHFLRAGIGFGGSCLVGEETVLVRRQGRVWSWKLEELFALVADEQGFDPESVEVIYPDDLEVLSWREGAGTPEFLPVGAATRRAYEGDVLEVRTKMGRRVTCTPDHPFVVTDGTGGPVERKLADELTESDWLPVAQGAPSAEREQVRFSALAGMIGAGMNTRDVLVRPAAGEMAALREATSEERVVALAEHPRPIARHHDIKRTGALRLDEAAGFGLTLEGGSAASGRSGNRMPFNAPLDDDFWHVAGLYIAEGHTLTDGRTGHQRLQWCFHPSREEHLARRVADFWARQGVSARVYTSATSRIVQVSSRLVASWWAATGFGRNSYEQRIPDAAWTQPPSAKRELLAGLWLGDGSWSYVAGGPSVVLEYGTASRELADGVQRMLGELGFVASQRVGRTKKSTVDTYWIRLAGADQVERALFLVPEPEREEVRRSLARQAKRIAPTGYRRAGDAAWVRVVDQVARPFRGHVYSLKVPESQTFVTTGGLVTSNCFPKDVSALKQLAGNSGYHFQLLSSVIEVNDLQKRRTIGKLQKHLGSLVDKEIALLGVAFKPHTDDVREATALVLAHRLLGEGAEVRIYDPVAMPNASELLAGARQCDSAESALDGADAVVLVTEWPEFRELDWAGGIRERMRNPLVVDGRNFLDDEALRAAGYTYEGIGRPAASAAVEA